MFCHLAVLNYLYTQQNDLGNSLLLNRHDFELFFFFAKYLLTLLFVVEFE